MPAPAAKRIESDEELQRLHLSREGFIYNDYSGNVPSGALGNVLHAAGCRYVAKANTRYPKTFFRTLTDAVGWISLERGVEGQRWRRCNCCRSEATTAPAPAPTPVPAPELPPASKQPRTVATKRVRPPEERTPFREGRVEDLLLPWLQQRGYAVKKQVRTGNGFIDMVATGPHDAWVIEAKGEDRGGFGTSEMNFRLGIAQICSRMEDSPGRKHALAIPVTPHFRRLLLKHRNFSVFEKMAIWLFAVDEAGNVTLIEPGKVQSFVDSLARDQ